MKKQGQKISLFGQDFKILESRTHFSKDPFAKTFEYTAECYIEAKDIVAISPWVMEGDTKTELALRTTWFDPKGKVNGWVEFIFHDAVCTSFGEYYDKEMDALLLQFALEAETVTRTDHREDAAMKSLLN